MQNYQFVTVDHPSQLTLTKNKRKVASYIGIHHRNRSQPSRRSSSWIQTGLVQNRVSDATQNTQGQLARQIPRDHHGIRVDPFESYPGKPTSIVPGAIDHCRYILRKALVESKHQ